MVSHEEAYTRCLNLLSRREYSQHELRYKMAQFVDDDVIDEVIQRLQADGYQSDERFVESFVRSRIGKRHGAKKIRYELQQKGIASDRADKELSKYLDEQLDNAKTLIERKLPRGGISELLGNFTLKNKVTRSLVSKGYDFEVINLAFEVLKEEESC